MPTLQRKNSSPELYYNMIDIETLNRMYCNEGKSALAIARELNIPKNTIYAKLREYKIPKQKLKHENIVGKTFGDWTVLKKPIAGKCESQCSCGNIKIIQVASLVHGKTTKCYQCRNNLKTGQANPRWQGFGEISGSWWKHNIKKTAEKRGIEFSITIEYAWNLFEAQKRKCALTGMPLCFANTVKNRTATTASLDRIDSSKGYIEGNVQWVHRTVSKMKMDLPQLEFIDFCKLVARHHE